MTRWIAFYYTDNEEVSPIDWGTGETAKPEVLAELIWAKDHRPRIGSLAFSEQVDQAIADAYQAHPGLDGYHKWARVSDGEFIQPRQIEAVRLYHGLGRGGMVVAFEDGREVTFPGADEQAAVLRAMADAAAQGRWTASGTSLKKS